MRAGRRDGAAGFARIKDGAQSAVFGDRERQAYRRSHVFPSPARGH
jgi:hypothetical protein